MEAVLSRKPENARIFTSIDHHKTPGVVRKAFPHNQDPKQTSVVATLTAYALRLGCQSFHLDQQVR
jgi:hypothetical protein